MHFPWDREQRLLEDPHDFDPTPYEVMQTYAEGMEVRLWTYPAVRALCEEHYPAVWAALRDVARPVMLVDVLRWVVVHRFGGIYWQMNSTPLVRMEKFLPLAGKQVRLFTEFDLDSEQCQRARSEPIRNGEPEESKRVMIQAFSAEPGAPFIEKLIGFLLERVRRYRPQKDYDILFITGNAAVSTAYDGFGRNDPGVQLTNLAESRRMVKLHYEGAWRTDRGGAPSPGRSGAKAALPATTPFWVRKCRDFYFRHMAVHPHEALFASRGAGAGGRALERLLPFIRDRHLTRVVEIADSPLDASRLPEGLEVERLHPSRAVIKARKREPAGRGVVWRHVSLLYSTFPRGDLFLCPECLEWMPFREALRILARIQAGGFRYWAGTGCPLMDRNWDSALGDFRPLNLRLAPFGYGEPLASIPWPDPEGRPDRCLEVWALPPIG
jgi:hypothetical protein